MKQSIQHGVAAALLGWGAVGCEDETRPPTQVVAPIPRDVGHDAPAPDAASDRGVSDRGVLDGGRDAGADMASADMAVRDMASTDMAVRDMARDMAVGDMAPLDMAPVDRGLPPDMAPPLDLALPDMAPPLDMALPDMAPPLDMALVDQGLPPGVRACANGPGTTLFAVHWDGRERPDIDHWAAACEPGFNINGCGAFARCGDAIANCGVAVVDGGQGLLLDGRDDLLFRFHVNGLQFQTTTLYFQARGTRGQGNLEVWSPIYGGLQGPVAGDAYAWYAVDWSDFLSPFDDPGVTGIRFRAVGGNVAVHAVEVCIE